MDNSRVGNYLSWVAVELEATMLRNDVIHMERKAETLPTTRLVGFVILFVSTFGLALVVLAA